MKSIFTYISLALVFVLGNAGSPLAADPSTAAAAPQRSRAPLAASAGTGYAVINVGGVDDVIEILLKGRQAVYRTVRGQNPQSLAADFSAPIPSVPNLAVRVSKLDGRGTVNLAGNPGRGNDYTVVLRIADPAGGRDNYRIRVEWSAPGSDPSPATPAVIGRQRPETAERRGPEAARGRIPGRVQSFRNDEQGWVEISLDGVDDIVDVSVKGSSAEYRTLRGRTPDQASAVFSNPFPGQPGLGYSIDKAYGRGDVTLTEAPSRGNDYTATIRLADPRGGKANYKFRLVWERTGTARNRPFHDSAVSPQARSGYVEIAVDGADDILDLRIRSGNVDYTAVKGATPRKVTFDFSTPLPRVPLAGMSLSKSAGRGEVVLMDRPDQTNGYTATIRIIDSERARDDYRFRLSWDVSDSGYSGGQGYGSGYSNIIESGGYQRIAAYAESSFQFTKEGSFEFRAEVDETALVKIEAGALWGLVERGRPMRVLNARFTEGYPNGEMDRLEIRKNRGRGDVEILEKPWSGNNYAIVVRINDSQGGADEYEFELRWKQR